MKHLMFVFGVVTLALSFVIYDYNKKTECVRECVKVFHDGYEPKKPSEIYGDCREACDSE